MSSYRQGCDPATVGDRGEGCQPPNTGMEPTAQKTRRGSCPNRYAYKMTITRPACRAIDELEAILEDIAQMTDGIEQLRNRLRDIPSKIASELPSETERMEAARYLYWTQPRLSAKAIAKDLLGTNEYELRRTVGSITADFPCNRCGRSVPVTSRTELRRGRPTCEDCSTALQQKSREEWEVRNRQVSVRLHELRTMSYREYLQSPEWKERRARHLKSAGFRCQICNAADTLLDVHHRTYERRGDEYFKDLIALCRDCHELFHREQRLTKDY